MLGEKALTTTERFIISTGRAGSTLLSHMLAENKRILSLSEFLGGVDNLDRFPAEPVTGERLARILDSADGMGVLTARRGLGLKEILFKEGGERWAPGRIPAIMLASLPFLDPENPEGLFDDMIAWAKAQPTRSIREQYLALFQWLCDRFGKEGWIERAGAALRYYDGMRRTFPNAKYVHIHRDGVAAAMSMREHNWFVWAAVYDEVPPTEAELREAIENPTDADPVTRLFKSKPPLEQFGRMWTRQIARGFREFIHLRPDQYLPVRFEDLQAHPEHELQRIGEFFELPDDPGWERRAADLIDTSLGQRPPNLPAEELERVRAAVLPGQLLLGREDPATLDEAFVVIRDAVKKYAPAD